MIFRSSADGLPGFIITSLYIWKRSFMVEKLPDAFLIAMLYNALTPSGDPKKVRDLVARKASHRGFRDAGFFSCESCVLPRSKPPKFWIVRSGGRFKIDPNYCAPVSSFLSANYESAI